MFSIYYLGEFHYFKVTELPSDLNNFHNETLENMGGEEELLIGHVYVSITVKV